MPIDARQFRQYVVRPALEHLEPEIPNGVGAEKLVLGTAIQESGLRHIDQLIPGPGPAYGLFQMEEATFRDHMREIETRPGLHELVKVLLAPAPEPLFQLRTNLLFAAAMCRIHYFFRYRGNLPDDLVVLSGIYKRIYNTPAGAATAVQWERNYKNTAGIFA